MRALITGANRGIGLELTRQLLRRGERVFAACRNPAIATSLHDLSAEYGGLVSIVQLDVSDPASIDASFETIIDCVIGSGEVDVDGLEDGSVEPTMRGGSGRSRCEGI